MADENLIDEEGKIDDADWAAAMAEQSATESAAATADSVGLETATASNASSNASISDDANADGDIDWAAAMAEQTASESAAAAVTAPAAATAAPIFPSFDSEETASGLMNELDMILDIPVQITVELGRTKISIKNLLQLAHGSVVELDAMAGEPMDVLVNGTLIAQGEVVVVNDRFGIRLTDIVSSSERMRKINH